MVVVAPGNTRRKTVETNSLKSYIHVGGFHIIDNRNKVVRRTFWARASGNWPSHHNSRHWPGHTPCPPHSLSTRSSLRCTVSSSRGCWHLLECLSAIVDCSEGYRVAYPPRRVRRIPKHLFACLTGAAAAEDRSGPAYDLDISSGIMDLGSSGSTKTYCE